MNKVKLNREQLQIKTEQVKSNKFYQIEGGEIDWVYVQPKSGTTFNTDSNSHLWSQLMGIYSQSNVNEYETTRTNGGYLDTMIGTIGTAYKSTGMYVGNISDSVFRTSLFKHFRLQIPVTGGTGSLSGVTSLNVYPSFVEQNDSRSLEKGGPCATYLVDSLVSESHTISTNDLGIGYPYDVTNNPSQFDNNQYNSGIVWLFNDNISYSGSSTGTTWDTGWSGNTRYTFDGGRLAKFDGSNRDESIGLVHLDSGLIALFHPDVVNNFNTTIATGGTVTSGLTFSSTDCNMIVRDIDISTELNINLNLNPDEFKTSNNPSLRDAKERGIECDGQVYITEICFYDDSDRLMGIGKVSEPVIKNEEDFSLITATVTLDGGVKDDPSDEVGRTTFPLPS